LAPLAKQTLSCPGCVSCRTIRLIHCRLLCHTCFMLQAPIHYSQVGCITGALSTLMLLHCSKAGLVLTCVWQVSLMDRKPSDSGDTSGTSQLQTSLHQAVRTKFRYLPDGTRTRVGVGPRASGEPIPVPASQQSKAQLGLGGWSVQAEGSTLTWCHLDWSAEQASCIIHGCRWC
jgi:hypothetical protein